MSRTSFVAMCSFVVKRYDFLKRRKKVGKKMSYAIAFSIYGLDG